MFGQPGISAFIRGKSYFIPIDVTYIAMISLNSSRMICLFIWMTWMGSEWIMTLSKVWVLLLRVDHDQDSNCNWVQNFIRILTSSMVPYLSTFQMRPMKHCPNILISQVIPSALYSQMKHFPPMIILMPMINVRIHMNQMFSQSIMIWTRSIQRVTELSHEQWAGWIKIWMNFTAWHAFRMLKMPWLLLQPFTKHLWMTLLPAYLQKHSIAFGTHHGHSQTSQILIFSCLSSCFLLIQQSRHMISFAQPLLNDILMITYIATTELSNSPLNSVELSLSCTTCASIHAWPLQAPSQISMSVQGVGKIGGMIREVKRVYTFFNYTRDTFEYRCSFTCCKGQTCQPSKHCNHDRGEA